MILTLQFIHKSEEIGYNYNLEVGPLFKVIILKNKTIDLIISVNHIIGDGWSLKLLIDEISEAINNNTYKVKLKDVSFIDYAKSISDYKLTSNYNDSLEYWKRKLINSIDGYSKVLFKEYSGIPLRNSFVFEKERLFSLKEKHGGEKIPLFSFLLSVLSLTIATEREDSIVNIATIFSNRQYQKLQEIIGNFSNLIIISNKIDSFSPRSEILKKVNKSFLEAYENQDVTYQDITRVLKVKTIPFEVLFVFNDFGDVDIDISEEEKTSFYRENTEYLIGVFIFVNKGKVYFQLEYNKEKLKLKDFYYFIEVFKKHLK